MKRIIMGNDPFALHTAERNLWYVWQDNFAGDDKPMARRSAEIAVLVGASKLGRTNV